jgi:hypothetical protein
MTGASAQDAVSPAHSDRDAMLGEIGSRWSKLSKQAVSELERNGEPVRQVVTTHRPNDPTGMDNILVLNGGYVERAGTRDEVVGGMVRPAPAQQRPVVASVAVARQGGDG